MKILKLQTLKGPNYWSIRRQKLIEMRLDLEEMNEVFSNQIPGFHEGLVRVLPELTEHFCSRGYPGGFLERVQEGTLMGHVMEHVAIELQTRAGMTVGFGRVRPAAESGVYRVVFEYENEPAGRYAARAAFRLVESLVKYGDYPHRELERDLEDLRELKEDVSLGVTTEAIVTEAARRNIPWVELPARRLVQLGYGVNQRRVQAAQTNHTGILGIEMAGDKASTITLLRWAGLPVPKGEVIDHPDDVQTAIDRIGGFPIVVKPLDGNHGRGITLNIRSLKEAEAAYTLAEREAKSGAVLVERFYKGRDFRVLVVNGKVVAVAERVPAHVVGDGRSTIAELVEETNRDPRRGRGHEKVLTRITIDAASEQVLQQQGYTVDSIPARGEVCYLKATANLSTGGIAIDRTDEIHPENVWIAQRAAKIIGLDIAGLDITAPAIDVPLRQVDGVIVEVNAAPGLRMHLQPSEGKRRNVAAPILDMLYPSGRSARIPITAIAGTHGATETTCLLSHILRQTGQTVGYATRDGSFIDEFQVEAGDTTDFEFVQQILQDPTVEVGVFETSPASILRSGLGFRQCDGAIVLNVDSEDVRSDITSLEDLAKVQSVPVEAVRSDGYAVLNADDPRVLAMASRSRAPVALFSLDPWNPVIWEHVRDGGMAAIYEEDSLVLLTGQQAIPLEQVTNLAVTQWGEASSSIPGVLAAALAAYVQEVPIETIRTALRSFRDRGDGSGDSHDSTANKLIDMGTFQVMVSDAQTPVAYEALATQVRHWRGDRIGVIGSSRDRNELDARQLGHFAARLFDRVIIHEAAERRDRKRGEVAALVREGFNLDKNNFHYEVILDEAAAIETALMKAPRGSLVVILSAAVDRALALLRNTQNVRSYC